MKKYLNVFYILTISKNDKIGLNKTIKSIDKLKTNFKIVHLVKEFCSSKVERKRVEINKKNLTRILITQYDCGIYNSMNQILQEVPNKYYCIFINSGDILEGFLDSIELKSFEDFYLIKSFKEQKKFNQEIVPKKTFLDGMPFCHQSLIFRKNNFMRFEEYFNISSDYLFVLEWINKKYESPLKIKEVNNLYSIFDTNGISSKKRFQRDLEGFLAVLRCLGILKSLVYISNRLKKYIYIIIK